MKPIPPTPAALHGVLPFGHLFTLTPKGQRGYVLADWQGSHPPVRLANSATPRPPATPGLPIGIWIRRPRASSVPLQARPPAERGKVKTRLAA